MVHREDCGIGSDSEGQREHRRGGESGIAFEAAQGVAEILRGGLEPRKSPGLAVDFRGLRHSTELAPRRRACRRGGHAALPEFLFLHGEVSGDLFIEIAIQAPSAKHGRQAFPKSEHGFSYSAGLRKRAISATVRSQSCDSRST